MSRFYAIYPQPIDETAVLALCDAYGIAPLSARALVRRGITSAQEADAFLHPMDMPLLDPLGLPDMPEAVVRICFAIKHNELICVYGDYDADGICASAILIRTLACMGGRVKRYIPSRHEEGYGLNERAVRQFAMEHVGLLITVDNGVSAHNEIALCRNLGIDVIVTDHHSMGATLPECCAVVSAKRTDSDYGNKDLCGAGVALKLAQALLPEENHDFDLALAAVATVADVVPLLGENRAIVAKGMRHVHNNIGLLALLQVSSWKEGQPISEQTLAFLIAPRLNAAGRIRDAMRGVELLLCQDEMQANALAQSLDADNSARRAAESGIQEQALAQLNLDNRALLTSHTDWNPGVIGIVASRLCEQYHRPVILFSEQDGVLTGSGRSPEGIDLYQQVSNLSRYFVRFGGHARAVGITIKKENFDDFCRAFNLAMNDYDSSCFIPAYGFEESVPLEALTVETLRELNELAPFGEGNPAPAYLIEGATVQNVSLMGKDGAHLSAEVVQGDAKLRLVAFRKGHLAKSISENCTYDLLIRPSINLFRDRETAELCFIAIKQNASRDDDALGAGEPDEIPGMNADAEKLFDAIFVEAVYNKCRMDDKIAEWYFLAFGEHAAFYTQQEMRGVYALWREGLSGLPELPDALASSHSAKELLALLVFMELAFFELDPVNGCIRPCKTVGAAPLNNSALYRRLMHISA